MMKGKLEFKNWEKLCAIMSIYRIVKVVRYYEVEFISFYSGDFIYGIVIYL